MLHDAVPHPLIESLSKRRLIRVGACPVLEIQVRYPRLQTADGEADGALVVFNEAYREMAESFLGWAQEAPTIEATEAFAALGSGARYRFDRRLLSCCMTAAWREEDGARLTVLREVRACSRRGELPARHVRAEDVWRWPELTLLPPARTRRRRG